MKIKLTKRGRNVIGAIFWLAIVLLCMAVVCVMLWFVDQPDYRSIDPHIQECVSGTVLQADGSCTNQEQ